MDGEGLECLEEKAIVVSGGQAKTSGGREGEGDK